MRGAKRSGCTFGGEIVGEAPFLIGRKLDDLVLPVAEQESGDHTEHDCRRAFDGEYPLPAVQTQHARHDARDPRSTACRPRCPRLRRQHRKPRGPRHVASPEISRSGKAPRPGKKPPRTGRAESATPKSAALATEIIATDAAPLSAIMRANVRWAPNLRNSRLLGTSNRTEPTKTSTAPRLYIVSVMPGSCSSAIRRSQRCSDPEPTRCSR